MRHRAKLVALRASVKCQVHAVLAGCGVAVPMSDLFGVAGQQLLARAEVAPVFRARISSATRVLDRLNFEIEVFTKLLAGRLHRHQAMPRFEAIPGVGAILAGVFVAEIGDGHRFPGPAQLASWADPRRHGSDYRSADRHLP